MSCQPAIATVSLGQSGRYNIHQKLSACANNGFKAIELFYDDLEALASSLSRSTRPTRDDLLNAARQIRALCDVLQIRILNLQPLRFYEGLIDRRERDRIAYGVIPTWMDILDILGSDTILIASNFLQPDLSTGKSPLSGDFNVIADDLRLLATLGAARSPPIKFAYEALAWGTYISTWEASWDIVQRVKMPNFGLAIDTFNIAGAVYADPGAVGGRNGPDADANLRQSLDRLANTVDVEKILIVQMADGERLAEALEPGHPFHIPGQPSRMSWSRNARLFLCEEDRGGYLPVLEILQTVVKMGWTGWLSYEIFSRTLAGPNPKTPEMHAARASRSWSNVTAFLGQSGNKDLE
ncbi:3-dehydroshikimate dehydratase [Aspergillus udagawae]|nr:3-dehydroshikimate dehydratase [Aspergillus udagawae]